MEYDYFQEEEYEEAGYHINLAPVARMAPQTSQAGPLTISSNTPQRIMKVQRISRGPGLMREVMLAASTASQIPTASYNIKKEKGGPYKERPLPGGGGGDSVCAVCGDQQAKLHYGVLACYGCKGFFRRTLAGKYRYACRFGNNCIVDKFQRNSCRYCRFNRCIEVGMDPTAVRPDRDQTGKQKVPRVRKKQIDEDLINHMMRIQGDDWSRKLPVEVRIMLMQLMNIEDKVVKGDNVHAMNSQQMIKNPRDPKSLREMFEQKPSMDSRRTEMKYEPFRMARTEELSEIAHRRAIAAVDWVDSLTEMAELADTEDKVNLVKACYSPLTIFNFSARTAQATNNPDILCLCSHSYVPRKLPSEFNETNHLSNVLIDRTLNELVVPLRKLALREEEIVPLKAIIILNPNAKGLSSEARRAVGDMRDKIQDMLFQVVKEMHPSHTSSSRFGNLLLLLPTITTLSGLMSENMQFCQAFGGRSSGDPLLSEMFGDFKQSMATFDKFNFDDAISSSISPPLFENPADINLEFQSISPPLLDSPTLGGSRRPPQMVDAFTQTEDGNRSPLSQSRSSHQLIGGGFSPLLTLASPFHLDDDLADSSFSPSQSLVDLGGQDDLFALMQ